MAKIRKQINKLTAEDMESCPYWELALDEENVNGQDESTVRPNPDWTLGAGLAAIRTVFTLSNGDTYRGFIVHDGAVKTPSTYAPSSDYEKTKYYDPVLLKGERQIAFWCGAAKPADKDVENWKLQLQEDATPVFPLRYKADVPDGAPVEGIVVGFTYVEREKKGLFKTVDSFKHIQ